MLILIISGLDVEVNELKQSAAKYGHDYIHVTGLDNASVVLSEYGIDAIIVAPGLSQQAQSKFMRALSLHPAYNTIPVSDLSQLSVSKRSGSETV